MQCTFTKRFPKRSPKSSNMRQAQMLTIFVPFPSRVPRQPPCPRGGIAFSKLPTEGSRGTGYEWEDFLWRAVPCHS